MSEIYFFALFGIASLPGTIAFGYVSAFVLKAFLASDRAERVAKLITAVSLVGYVAVMATASKTLAISIMSSGALGYLVFRQLLAKGTAKGS